MESVPSWPTKSATTIEPIPAFSICLLNRFARSSRSRPGSSATAIGPKNKQTARHKDKSALKRSVYVFINGTLSQLKYENGKILETPRYTRQSQRAEFTINKAEIRCRRERAPGPTVHATWRA